MNNPLKLNGIDFIEFSAASPEHLQQTFTEFGFSKLAQHQNKKIDLYIQGGINFMLNHQKDSFAYKFQVEHGPSVSSMGWRVENANFAFEQAVARGARPCETGDYHTKDGKQVPAIYGIGDSLIYFIEADQDGQHSYTRFGFEKILDAKIVLDKGFLLIDHLTNNVFKGTMEKWSSFYKDVFGFEEVRFFDIKGQKTGLTSYALRSPCGLFSIPINEANEKKSQINEYLEEYKGPGVQHIALLTRDLISSVNKLEDTSVKTLDISSDYYKSVFERVPSVKEDKQELERLNILADGDHDGYLLQIFTKNIIGPIFFEMIQRENHLSFGEGNFQALFESIERDQMKRGFL